MPSLRRPNVTSPFSRRATALPAAVALATLCPRAAAQQPLPLVEASIVDLHARMQAGELTAEGLVQRYLARIAAYDRTGANLRAVLAVNPDAIAEARQRDRDARAGVPMGPLFGIPVLLKDNVDALPLPTTAGSVALATSLPPDDAFLADRLRRAGAVVIGKATLTEFANFMAFSMPNGYSSLGGHGANPYDPRRASNGAALADTGGSSSGSGIATAANLTCVAIGTETSGSILSPSSSNGVVGIKPTVGLVSRDGILPISADHDTAGPIARTVADAAAVLSVIAGYDPRDPATAACLVPGNCHPDYTQFLDANALQGARIAVPRGQFWGGLNSEQSRIMTAALTALRNAGAVVVDPVTIPNLNLPGLALSHPPAPGSSTSLIFAFKRDLNRYLASLGPAAPRATLQQIIAFNSANAATALVYGQGILTAADLYDATPNSQDDLRYQADRARDLATARTALDATYNGPDGVRGTSDDFDAILVPANYAAYAPAVAGYPSICVPGGFMARGSLPSLPFGVTFSGRAFSEGRLIALAYAFEQATRHRLPPSSTPALPTDTVPMQAPAVQLVGAGCSGSNGVPAIASVAPPVLGSSAFAVVLSSLRPNAVAFVGVSTGPGSGTIGSCGVHAGLPYAALLTGTSSGVGTAELPLPIPWLPALSGLQIWLQGGVLDAQGGALGVAALSPGLAVTIGG